MRELVRTNDAVLVSAMEALLTSAGIDHLVLDQNMSVLEGSLGILPRRVLVPDNQADEARKLLRDAGLGHELRPDASESLPQGLTEDTVLGGRVRLRQPRRGHRVGHDAILLAAAVAAAEDDHAVDLGAGVGAAGLALARRIPGVRVTLVEIDPALADLADENVVENGFKDRVASVVLDVAGEPAEFAQAGLPAGCAQHVLMNPPFNLASAHQVSPDPDRARAHVASAMTLAVWTKAAVRLMADRATLTLIWRADGLAEALQALEGLGGIAVLPVHPAPKAPAVRVLVRAIKRSRAPLRLLPPLILNDAQGRPTAAANAVLRDAAPLLLASDE